MKIIELRAENFKRLVAVDIRPDGAVVPITGKNGQGKSSVLDAIWVALAGTRVAPPVPVRKGAERATIALDIGRFKVTRTFKLQDDGETTTTLKVENEAGVPVKSPQDVLNAICGALTFDPLEFERMKPKDQFDALKALVPGVDFANIARRRQEAFETRTSVKRRLQEVEAQAAGITLPPGKLPDRVDVAELEMQLAKASDHNSTLERRRAGRAQSEADCKRLQDEIAELEERLVDLRERLEAKRAQLANAEPLPEPIDAQDVAEKLKAGREANAVLEVAARKADLTAKATELQKQVDDLTKTIDACDQEKLDAVAKAKMPVAGLGFGDEEVLLNGVPFAQASDAERLRTAIAIAGALSPELRVIRVRDGSRLDSTAMALLEEYAQANDLQVWIERVDESGAVGFVLEEGYLKGERPAAPAPAEEMEDEAV